MLRFTAGEDHALDNRLVAYDVRASIAHAEMLHDARPARRSDELDAIRNGLTEIAAAHARGEWSVTLDLEDGQTALETLLTRRIGAAGARLHAGRSRNDQVLDGAAALPARRGRRHSPRAPAASPTRSTAWRRGRAHVALPGYTHMQQAMPSSVALWARGFAAEIRDDVDGAAPRAPAHPQEPARLGRRLRHARTCRSTATPRAPGSAFRRTTSR